MPAFFSAPDGASGNVHSMVIVPAGVLAGQVDKIALLRPTDEFIQGAKSTMATLREELAAAIKPRAEVSNAAEESHSVESHHSPSF